MIKISNFKQILFRTDCLGSSELGYSKRGSSSLDWFFRSWKSTFLRSLNYLETPDSGSIQIDDFSVDFF